MARRWLFYLAINILVSAATMLTVLVLWDRSSSQEALILPATVAPTVAGQPSATSTRPPTPTPFLYSVKAGDTLGGIAVAFDVDIDELMRVNNITNPHSLEVDMVLIIPVVEHPEGEGASRHPTVTPREGEGFPWPRIDLVAAPGTLEREALRIVNEGPTIQLSGWKILSPRGESYVFGDFSLVTGGAVSIHTGAGSDTPIDLFWNLAAPAWQSGDEIMLFDAQAFLRSVFFIP